jgi:hypothetical protein
MSGWYFLVGFLLNAVSDYASLFVIRPMLIRSGTKPVIGLSLGAVTGVVIVSAVSTTRLILFTIFTILSGEAGWENIMFWPAMVSYLVPSWRNWFFAFPAMAVFAWLPLFALGILTARLLTPLSWIVGRTQWFLREGKEHPLKAIGYVAAVVVFIGTVAGRVVFGAV